MKEINQDNYELRKPAILFSVSGILLASLSLQSTSLIILDWNYSVNIPILKYIILILKQLNGWGIESCLIISGLLTIAYVTRKEVARQNIWFRILCAVFALCMVVGKSFADTNSLSYFTLGKLQFTYTFVIFLGYIYFFYIIVGAFLFIVRKVKTYDWFAHNKFAFLFFERHPVLLPFCAMLICALPYVIIFFPGTVQWDGHAQVYYYFRLAPWTNHHPLFCTWLMGSIFSIGRNLFHSDNIGIFLYVFPQLLFQCFVFALSFRVFQRMKLSMFMRILALIYFALFPLWPISGISFMKDTMYYILVIWNAEALIESMLDLKMGLRTGEKEFLPFIHTGISIRNACWFVISGCLSCLFRHNGTFLVIGTSIFGFLLCRKLWSLWIYNLVSLGLTLLLVNVVMASLLQVGDWPSRESMSVPLQQTARYVQQYGDEVTTEEKESIAGILPYENVEHIYNPENADGIKGGVYDNVDSEAMSNYWRTWLRQGLKHPLVYLEAFLNQSYGYFYPNKSEVAGGLGCYYIGSWESISAGVDIYFASPALLPLRQLLRVSADILREIPILGMLYSTGAHTFLVMGGIALLCAKKRKRDILVLIPSILTIGICMLSPINAVIRYMLPVMVSLPTNMAWVSMGRPHISEPN
jgi:hypothetical protein